jgi:DNA-binding NarL/FixJ family response regulator
MTFTKNAVSVLVAIANAMSGELIGGALNRQACFRVVANATTSKEVLEAAQSVEFDVALIGASLADGPSSGFGALRQLREIFPDLKSVVLLDSPELALVEESFRAGAKGVFCPSQSAFKSLCRCVNQVHAGQIWASSDELSYVMDAFSQLSPKRVVSSDGLRLLTNREEDVVRLLSEGMQNRDIARELHLSEHTVKNYLFRIFDKLGVSSRVELVLYAVSSTKRATLIDMGVDMSGEDGLGWIDLKPPALGQISGRAAGAGR